MGLTAPIIGGRTTTPGMPVSSSQNGTHDLNTLQIPCDHQQLLERYQVSPLDLRTLQFIQTPIGFNMRAPINGLAVVEIFIHGEPITINDPTYGYQILPDPDRIQMQGSREKFYKIVFNKEVRLIRPLIEISYLTRQDYCLKCSSVGVLNDFSPSPSGSFHKVHRLIKLSQRSLKMVLTSRCAFYPQFTCPIKDYIGRKFGVNITDSDIANAIVNSLNNLKQIQTAQNTFQPLSPEETLRDITNVSALQDDEDPTVVHVTGTITSFSGNNTGSLNSTPFNFAITVVP